MSKYKGQRLEGKVCVVTASTDGIGLAIAKRLALEGAKIVISSRKQENVDKAIKMLKNQGINEVIGTTCHVAIESDRKKLFSTAVNAYKKIDCLVSNAAVNPEFSTLTETSEEAWDKIFDVNVKAAYLLAKEVKPYLQQNKSGSIILISSVGGYSLRETLAAYLISKTTLFGLTKALAMEMVNDNIRVNCVAPGIIKTRFAGIFYATKAQEEESLKLVPMRRFGNVDEISGVVAFLVSDDASYITGETLVAAGGVQSRL